MLPVTMLIFAGAWQVPLFAATCTEGSTCVTVDGSGGAAMSKEQARESKEQWDETKSLRKKVNTRTEKEFDKQDRAIDDEEQCNDINNVNAYWEQSTRKCIDRKTGHRINL
ncbi:DUF1283 family protein [Serratia sp. UGAL515B_01]|nr:DUF1283 family protein [Serratia sp. UGAL515B_01]WON78917.1 DUF1283 family protein [Serratia sp. UGAL515B_01]